MKLAVDNVRGGFVIPSAPASIQGEARRILHALIEDSFVDAIRIVMLIAAALAFAGAICAVFTIRSDRSRPNVALASTILTVGSG